jgi:hypothetical protein
MISTLVRLSRPPRLDSPYDERDAHASAARIPRSQPGPVQEVHPQASVNASPPSALTSGRAALALVRLCIEVLNGYRRGATCDASAEPSRRAISSISFTAGVTVATATA